MPSGCSYLLQATGMSPQPSTERVCPQSRSKLELALRCWSAGAVLAVALSMLSAAEPIKVRHPEGTLHGFLSLATETGQVLAAGDLIEVVEGDRVTSHLTFHFKDGSLDEETTVYTQRGVFRLISDRHIQRGPYFPHPLDMTIEAAKGVVIRRSPGKDGKDEVTTDRIKLPPDLYNGLVTPVIKNVSPNAGETKVSMIVATPKPRIVTLEILPQAPETFHLAGFPRKATVYQIKIELGGLASVIAPVIGKQPPDIYISIEAGQLPAFLREKGPLFEGGSVLTISLIGPTWSADTHASAR
jgi:hypothetical protein